MKRMYINKEYISDISKEVLFESWISPKMAIDPIIKIECSPIAGEVVKLYSGEDENSGIMVGKFLEVVRNEKLKYTWNWLGSKEKTIFLVEFKQDKSKTIVKLKHSGFLSEESKKIHDSGWDSYFYELERKINGIPGK